MNDEIFAVVNKEDQVVGQASRKEVHGNPALIHRVVHVLVFNKQGELYLQKRSLNKDVQPGKWDTSVGGHVDLGEDYRKAALREMHEELGIKPNEIRFLYKYLHASDFESEIVSSFHCFWNGSLTINQDEISEGRFWALDEIQERGAENIFTPNLLDELVRYQQFVKHHQHLKN